MNLTLAIIGEFKFDWHGILFGIASVAVISGVGDTVKSIFSGYARSRPAKAPGSVRVIYRTADGKKWDVELHTRDAERMVKELSEVEVDVPVKEVSAHVG